MQVYVLFVNHKHLALKDPQIKSSPQGQHWLNVSIRLLIYSTNIHSTPTVWGTGTQELGHAILLAQNPQLPGPQLRSLPRRLLSPLKIKRRVSFLHNLLLASPPGPSQPVAKGSPSDCTQRAELQRLICPSFSRASVSLLTCGWVLSQEPSPGNVC